VAESSDCIFCKIIQGDIPAEKIYEGDQVLAFLDVGPLSDCHTLVIPKFHCARLDQCPAEFLAAIAKSLPMIASAVVETVDADGYNVLSNTGRAAGQLVGHLHFHVIPRHTGDGLFKSWPANKYKEGEIKQFAKKIRQNIQS
jgi:histidine triad (HIT) family protein